MSVVRIGAKINADHLKMSFCCRQGQGHLAGVAVAANLKWSSSKKPKSPLQLLLPNPWWNLTSQCWMKILTTRKIQNLQSSLPQFQFVDYQDYKSNMVVDIAFKLCSCSVGLVCALTSLWPLGRNFLYNVQKLKSSVIISDTKWGLW